MLGFGSVCHFAGTFHESELSAGAMAVVGDAFGSTGGCPGGKAVDVAVDVVVVMGGSLAITAVDPVDPVELDPPSCIDRPAAKAPAPTTAATMRTVDRLNRFASLMGEAL